MQEGYYIHTAQGREGPVDSVALMRKLRAGKIDANTPLSTTFSDEVHPLQAYPSLQPLLRMNPEQSAGRADTLRAEALFMRSFMSGARLINRYLQLCVVTGIIVFLILIVATLAGSVTSFLSGYLVWLFAALTLYPVLQLIALHIFRGHYTGPAVLRDYLLKRLPAILLLGALMAVLTLAGVACLLIPGILVFTLIVFAIPLLGDGNNSPTDCISRSASLVSGGGMERFGALLGLCSLNILSLLVIIPVPVIWPLVAGAIADLYEDAAHSTR